MWDRKMLKSRGMAAFKRNYWKCVAVALIIVILTAGAAGSRVSINQVNGGADLGIESIYENPALAEYDRATINKGLAVLTGILALAGLTFGAIGIVFKVFVKNIFEVGGAQFFLHNSYEPTSVGEILSGFKSAYINKVVTMLKRDIFIILWSLLLVIPGVIKAYSYRLVPYIIADDENISSSEALELSKTLMQGQKWNTFVLDLSFLGWMILSSITFGILGVFYVNPYIQATNAELYRAIRSGVVFDYT